MKNILSNPTAEFVGYGAVAVASALVVAHFALPPALSMDTFVVRTAAQAERLRSYLGVGKADTVVVEFMDFQCPPCRASWPGLRKVLRTHPRVAYRPVNYPLSMHRYAFGAAVASEVARTGGQFDAAFDDLFTGKTPLDPKSLNAYLSGRKLAPVVGTRDAEFYKQKVRAGMKVADELKCKERRPCWSLLQTAS